MRRENFIGTKGFTQEDTRYEYEYQEKTPEGAPNVVYIVLDDMGFSHLGCYGSNINTPNLDRLAEEGLRYNNFHTTAICSATRASLLTGMNHHTAGIAAIVEWMTGCDNGIGHLHRDCATLAEILKEYDYGTCAVGKWHLTDVTETTEAGPYDNWPLGKGFDRYYGFLHAQMDQYHPRLWQDNTQVDPPKTPEEGYHFSEDITDHAIRYIYHQKTVYPEKPIFLYMAFGAMHTPHHAPKEYIDKYKGKFDEGWDVARQQWFARQKELGIIPQNAELTQRNTFVRPWAELSENQKKINARYMEAYAGMLEHTDAQIGRLLDYLREIGELDHTVVVFLSDNGASAEGGPDGTINNFRKLSGLSEEEQREEEKFVLEHLDEIGGPNTFNHYSFGWANAGNTPFPWYKMWTYSGGVKDPMIVRYPKLITDPGAVRSQYHHVSDITPTILDILGVKKPEYIKGVHQKKFQGTSFKYTLVDGNAPDRKHVQYYEMIGNRAIYKDGWKAIINHSQNASEGRFEDDVWELYHVEEDYSEAHNVADQYPEKVAELERTWLIEAASAGVFPMLAGTRYGSKEASEKLNQYIRKKDRYESYEHILEPLDIIRGIDTDLNHRSHVVRIAIKRENKNEQGILFANGNYHGGFSIYIKDNHLKFTYNYGSRHYYMAEGKDELPVGELRIEYRSKFRKDNTILVELLTNGVIAAQVEVPKINVFTDYVTTIGANKNSSVAPMDYQIPFCFNGTIQKVELYVEGHLTTREKELETFFMTD